MEENYSDTDHIIAGRKEAKFHSRITGLRTFILVLSAFGFGLASFALITWNSSSNDILKFLSITGILTIFASGIGLYGCHRCLKHMDVVKTSKMKENPGQTSLLIFFYLNFVLFCAFLLFGTWCFFYQDDATAWLEAKYSDKQSWERDFKGISLATVQGHIRLILNIAGVFALSATIVSFCCIYYAMKITMLLETIHTVVQVQNMVLVLIAFLIVYSGLNARNYYKVPKVEEAEPEFLPQVLIFTGIATALVAYLGFFASKAESKIGLISYTVFCFVLMANFLIFTVLLNFGSQLLQSQFEEKCNEIMPYFHKNFYENFGCMNKYSEVKQDYTYLTCDKENIVTIWEGTENVDVSEQTDSFGCLNQQCCEAMISFVKGKFNFLAAFCIVAFFFILVAIMTAQYMHKKIKKYHTQILSHKNDNTLFLILVAFTVGLSLWVGLAVPQGPRGKPQPDKSLTSLQYDFTQIYDVHVDRNIGVGALNEEGWWDFNRISIFQEDVENCTECNEIYTVSVSIASFPNSTGEFKLLDKAFLTGNHTTESTNTSTITPGKVDLHGKINDVNHTLTNLRFRPACITDSKNALNITVSFLDQGKVVNAPRNFVILMNVNSGQQRKYRSKFIEENLNANGQPPYFKELTTFTDLKVQVSMPYFHGCPTQPVSVDVHGIAEFNMTVLNYTIPYTMKIEATKTNFDPISVDYFVGGYPNSDIVELGTFSFYKGDNQLHNVSGRVFDAFTNKTFAQDYSITVFSGYGEFNQTSNVPYEQLDFLGNGEYYTGFYELYDLKSGIYTSVAEANGYIKNFQRFYALPSPPYTKLMRSTPLVPVLGDGELALTLTWGYSPRDLDIHVEFVASPTIMCKCDFSMKQCGGVKYMADTMTGGERGSDVIKFDYIGDYQYIVYVSLYHHKTTSPKAGANQQNDLSLAESQAQLKLFSPYYTWPVYVFDVPAAPASGSNAYWKVFCFNGKDGLRNIVPLNVLQSGVPDVSDCHNIFGLPEFLKTNSTQAAEEIQP